MHNFNATSSYFDLKDAISNFYPSYYKPSFKVKDEVVHQKLRSLADTLDDERFFFVVDVLNFEITYLGGVQRWLGYFEKEFSLRLFFRIIHPEASKILSLSTFRILQMACMGHTPPKILSDTKHITLLPLKHIDGSYLYLRKASSAFQYDDEYRLLSFLNEFTIVGPYEGHDIPRLSPRFVNPSQNLNQFENDIKEVIRQGFSSLNFFSYSELSLLHTLAYKPETTRAELSDQFGVKLSTIDTLQKRALSKARDYFIKDFKAALDVATFLQSQGLL